ncbi:PEPxxWA-CTERM sorting domain-containing protein [Sandaracinobacteroides sp. A072]|uniref:PEPxxWA-CTERM sorting domain-containing protein n=1 Tax=Sandaracinobacteroides sp. A072 TaxID=3461146 RepID=UPI00404170EC
MIGIFARFAAVAVGGSLASAAFAGTLVASGDEWQLSNYAYDAPYIAGTTQFVNSLAATFGGSDYLFLTGNGNVSQSMLSQATAQFQSLGKAVSYATSFDLASASAYDAVFHFGQSVNTEDFATYVNGGGNAYVSLGGGWWGSAAAEAAVWNPVFAQFGLIAGSTWFPVADFVQADVTVGPSDSLIWGYGQSIEKLIPQSSSQSYVRGTFFGGPEIGLIGSSTALVGDVSGVPEPATWALMITGFGLVGSASRRKRAIAC